MSATLHPNVKLLEVEDHPGAGVVVLREGVRQVAVVNTLEEAHRLVACWNACVGIPTELIEQGGFAAVPVTTHREVKAQRDELLADIRQLITGRMGAEQIREALQRAIAKAQGGAA